MKKIATIYGDWSQATTEAAEALSKSGIPFRVCLSHDSPGTPTLSMPFGELRGLQNIRTFAQRAMGGAERPHGALP